MELLADLQGGLLDDDAAARVRRRVRADPDAEATVRALNRVRSDVAALSAGAADPASAPTRRRRSPPGFPRRCAQRAARPPAGAAHSARPPHRPARVIAGVAGASAVVAAIGLGTTALVNAPDPRRPQITAAHITVSTPPTAIPLSDPQISACSTASPDYGPPPGRSTTRAARVLPTGLGYPASTRVLGAQPVEINARPGVCW